MNIFGHLFTMSDRSRGDERYFPTEAELHILIPKLHEYFGYGERSVQRKTCCAEAWQAVLELNPTHWTKAKVRLWFNNNKNTYLSNISNRIPTPYLPPVNVSDSNLRKTPAIPRESIPDTEQPEQVETPVDQENESSESKQIILPDLPTITDDMTVDDLKWTHYQTLTSIYPVIRDVGALNETQRLEKQKDIEELFGNTINQLKQFVPHVFSADNTARLVTAKLTKQMQRQVSKTTQSYAKHGETPARSCDHVIEETCKDVFAPRDGARGKNEARDPVFAAFYKGQGTQEQLVLNSCFCSAFVNDKLVYAHLNARDHLYGLVIDDTEIHTGFFTQATAMVYDEPRNIMWVAGDCRVRGFSLDKKECVATLCAGNEPIVFSVLLVWGGSVVLATGQRVMMWNDPEKADTSKRDCKDSEKERLAERLELSKSHIVWTRGSIPITITESLPAEVSCACCVGSYIAVGSAEHHAIRLLARDGTTRGILVGHTGGITSLCPRDDTTFFSGSEDWTIKMWNVEAQCAEVHYQRHSSPVISISYGVFHGREFMFSAGSKDMVRAWVLGKTSTFEVHTEPREPKSVQFVSSSRKLVVMSQEPLRNRFETKPYVCQIFTFDEPEPEEKHE